MVKIIVGTIKNVSLVVIFVLLSFSSIFAFEINDPENKSNSIYQYNALENKNSFPILANNVDNLGKELSKNNNLPDDITKKLEDIILKQNFSTTQIDGAINTIKNKSGLTIFLIGDSLGVLRFQIVQIKDMISEFNALVLQTQDSAIKTQIENRINFLKEKQIKVENFIFERENKFSLFGWLVASF